jgi:hypothetical protein
MDMERACVSCVGHGQKQTGKSTHCIPGQPGEQHAPQLPRNPQLVLKAKPLCALAAVDEVAAHLVALACEQKTWRTQIPCASAEHLHMHRTYLPHIGSSSCIRHLLDEHTHSA